jgi:hypothetical protein
MRVRDESANTMFHSYRSAWFVPTMRQSRQTRLMLSYRVPDPAAGRKICLFHVQLCWTWYLYVKPLPMPAIGGEGSKRRKESSDEYEDTANSYDNSLLLHRLHSGRRQVVQLHSRQHCCARRHRVHCARIRAFH